MKRTAIISILLCLTTVCSFSQRVTDKLNRGLVAMKVTDGVFLSWRITAEEYYDTEYNVYRDGTKLNTEPLITHTYPLSKIDEAYELFENKRDGVIKIAVTC